MTGTLSVSFTDDLGADRFGESECSTAFDALTGIDRPVEIQVPPGIYPLADRTHRINPQNSLPQEQKSVSFIPGPGGSVAVDGTIVDRPRFVAPEDYSGTLFDFAGPSIDVQGVDIDRRGLGAGPQTRLRVGKSASLTDIRLLDRDDTNSPHGAMFDVRSAPQATVHVDRLDIPHGADWTREMATSGDRVGRPGIYAGPHHEGTLRIERSVISECSSYGIEASESPGRTVINDCTFRNSNRAQIRFGGPLDVLRDSTIVVDLDTVTTPNVRGTVPVNGVSTNGYVDARGVRLCRDPQQLRTDDLGDETTIVDSSIHIRSLADRTSDSQLVARSGAIRGSATASNSIIRSCTVRSDVDGIPAIRFDSPATAQQLFGNSDIVFSRGVEIHDTTVGGFASDGTTVAIYNRPTTITGSCVERSPDRTALDIVDNATVTTTDVSPYCDGV